MDPHIKPIRSAQIPMMSDLQARFIKQLDDDATYMDLFVIIEKMAQDLLNQDKVPCREMIRAVEGDLEEKEMRLLLHSIPRPVLRSLVMRTLAYDFWEKDTERRRNMLYDFEGPGVYVMSLSIEGRHGEGWSIEENNQLLTALMHYGKAIEACEKRYVTDDWGNSQFDDETIKSLNVAMKIDKQYAESDVWDGETYPMPRFASTSNTDKSKHVRELFHLLETSRNVAGWDRNANSLQSVCMVGNSDDVEKQKQSHSLIGSLTNTPHTWGLLVSCLRYIGLEPEETCIPICKSWKPEHTNQAEILITILSGSLISVGGLNVHQLGLKPGSNPPPDKVFEQCRKHVWLNRGWFKDNLEHTLMKAPGYSETQKTIADIFQLTMEDIKKMAMEEEESRNLVVSSKLALEREIENTEEECDKAEEALKYAKEVSDEYELLKGLFF